MKVRMFGSFDGIPEMGKTPQRGWSPAMGSRARGEGARQVKCLIASAGHEWMIGYFDRLPAPVRHRCLTEEACRREPRPSIATFIRVLTEIERQLDDSSAGERASGRKPGPVGF
jgi:hypothetical protein